MTTEDQQKLLLVLRMMCVLQVCIMKAEVMLDTMNHVLRPAEEIRLRGRETLVLAQLSESHPHQKPVRPE